MYYIVLSLSIPLSHQKRQIEFKKKRIYNKPNHKEKEFHHQEYILHHLCFRSLNQDTNFESIKQKQLKKQNIKYTKL